jgi:hypothetical protein
MTDHVADPGAMNKPYSPKPLAALAGRCLANAFKRQGFTSCELVTRWEEIVGSEIAAHAEPIRMQWSRASDPDESPPATLVLRVEGPTAIEIQHQSAVIVERINRYFGWQALAGIALRQAPLARRRAKPTRQKIDQELADAISSQMTGIADDALRAALGRLGAAIKRT